MKTTMIGSLSRLLFVLAVLSLIRNSTQTFCGIHDSYQEYAWDGNSSTTQPDHMVLYRSNLYYVLNDLPNKESIGNWSFSDRYLGEEPNAAYAIALCIGDVSFDNCLNCVGKASNLIYDDCSNKTNAAIIWYGDCHVRYSNHRIYGLLSMPDEMVRVWNDTADVASSDADAFDGERTKLFNALADKTPVSNKYFVAGKRHVASSNMTIYGASHCSPDLYKFQCSDCLAIVGRKVEEYFHGKIGGKVVGPSCNFWYEIHPFVNESAHLIYDFSPPPSPPPPASPSPPPPASPSPPPPASPSPSPSPPASPSPSPPPPGLLPPNTALPPSSVGKKGSNKYHIVIYVVAPIVLCVILLVGIYACLRKKKPKQITQNAEIVGTQRDEDQMSNSEPDYIMTEDTLQYAFSTVSAATNNFSESNKLGQGGFGAVYKGMLQNGCEIAVKRLSETSMQGEAEFKTEVTLMANLQHRNLVRLLGFCLKQKERLLIYEFVANSSLDKFIFDPVKRAHLNWDRICKIIAGIARGLLYLHEDSRLRIIHRDLKSSNILLDDEMTPKIADFGMARLFVRDEAHGSTNRIVGTFGYMAPEYVMHGQFSFKSDVFSFGVLLLEIVCGLRNSFFRIGESVEDLLSYVWKSWQEGTVLNLIDPTLRLEKSSNLEMTRYIHIGLVCAQEDVIRRPTMASVVNMLSNLSVELPVPSKPAFSQQGINYQDHDWSLTDKSDESKYKSGGVWSTMELRPR